MATARWHVNPWVDTAAYGWSWVLPLGMLLPFGNTYQQDYIVPFALLVGVSFAHRHATIPYVYLDREVFSSAPYAFTVLPVALLAGFFASMWHLGTTWEAGSLGPAEAIASGGLVLLGLQLWGALSDGHGFRGPVLVVATLLLGLAALGSRGAAAGVALACALLAADQRSFRAWLAPAVLVAGSLALVATDVRWPSRDLRALDLIAAISVIASAWNVWHVLQQKYGILRMYAAKAGGGPPGWVDRVLLWGTLPLAAVGASWGAQAVIDRVGAELSALQPLVDLLNVSPWVLAGSSVFALGSVALWASREARFASVPRMSMAAGVVALHLCFLCFDPVKVYVAYAASHAVEYLVFLWAFQRRRYARKLGHDPVMGRIVQRGHGRYWVALILGGAAVYVVGYHSDDLWLDEPWKVAGIPLWRWVVLWGLWQSLSHFAWDGFLWKMRKPSTRASL